MGCPFLMELGLFLCARSMHKEAASAPGHMGSAGYESVERGEAFSRAAIPWDALTSGTAARGSVRFELVYCNNAIRETKFDGRFRCEEPRCRRPIGRMQPQVKEDTLNLGPDQLARMKIFIERGCPSIR